MATPKSKKTSKSQHKPKNTPAKVKETVKVETEVVETKENTTKVDKKTDKKCKNPFLNNLFKKKFDETENILTFFKRPRSYAAILSEVIGTMLIAVIALSLGTQLLFALFVMLAVVLVSAGISGANLNPIVTAGMMATRRMSAIRGVVYMLSQLVGAWLGFALVNSFRLTGERITGQTGAMPSISNLFKTEFWAVALVELLGAVIIGFFFAKAWKHRKNKEIVAFSLIATLGVWLATLIALVITSNYFGSQNAVALNPVMALMQQILPSSSDDLMKLVGEIALALAAYALIPMIGGVIGFYLSDTTDALNQEELK